jgi:hypothetical protein
MAVRGASLAELAFCARLPLWTRALPPEAFSGPVPRLPGSAAFFCRIANHMPASKDVGRWLQAVAFAAHWGDEDIAVWMAREFLRAPKLPRRRRQSSRTKLLTLWAWFSRQPGTRAHGLIDHAWNPAMGAKAALGAAATWWNAVELFVQLGDAPLSNLWLAPGSVDGYDFVALASAADVVEEARAMENCLRLFGSDLAENYVRFWSIRQGRQRIATLRVDSDACAPMPRLVELQALRNQPAPPEVWLAAHRWLLLQDQMTQALPAPRTVTLDRSVWRSLWKPYWLAKGHFPVWLPLAPTWEAMWAF